MDGCELSLQNSALSCAHRAGSCGPAPNSSRVLERGSGIQPDPSAQVVICGFFLSAAQRLQRFLWPQNYIILNYVNGIFFFSTL